MPAITFILVILLFCQCAFSQEELEIPGVVVIGEDRSVVVLGEEMLNTLPKVPSLIDYAPVPKFSTFSVMPAPTPHDIVGMNLLSVHCGNRNITYGIYHEKPKKSVGYAISIDGLRNFGTNKFNKFDEDKIKLFVDYGNGRVKGMFEISRVDKDVYLPYLNKESKKNFTRAIFKNNFGLAKDQNKQWVIYLEGGHLKLQNNKDDSMVTSLGYNHSKDNYDFAIQASYLDKLYGMDVAFKSIDLTKYLKIAGLVDVYLGLFNREGVTVWTACNFRYKDASFFVNLGRRLEISNLGDVYMDKNYLKFNPNLKLCYAKLEFKGGIRKKLTDVVVVDTSVLWQRSKDFIVLLCEDADYLDKPQNSKINWAAAKLILEYDFTPKIKQITSLEYNLFSSRKIPHQPIYIITPIFQYNDNKLLFEARVNIVGEAYISTTSSHKLPQYTTANLYFSQKFTERFSIFAKIENLFNKTYKKHKYYQADKFSATLGMQLKM